MIYRFWNAFFRIARFSGSNPNQLQTAEGEHNYRQRQNQPIPAGGEETTVAPEVVDTGFLAAVPRKQQPQAKADHTDDRQHFNQRKPELGFTI